MSTKAITKPRISLKMQMLAAIAAVAGAVVIPQIFHILGAASGLGTAPGEIFLPMHLPIILAGFLAGPYAGAAAGLAAPLVSFFLTSMPTSVMLPFMMIELCAYGIFSGVLANVKLPDLVKVAAVQLAGRAVRALAILFAVYVLSNKDIAAASIWMSVVKGLPGLALQWALIPLVIYRVRAK